MKAIEAIRAIKAIKAIKARVCRYKCPANDIHYTGGTYSSYLLEPLRLLRLLRLLGLLRLLRLLRSECVNTNVPPVISTTQEALIPVIY